MIKLHRTVTAISLAAALLIGTTACTAPEDTGNVEPAASSETKDVETIVSEWVESWQTGDAARMAELFTSDGTYVDNAFSATSTGPAQVSDWVELTSESIDGLTIERSSVFSEGNNIAVTSTLSGQLRGAPEPFSVPMTSIITIENGHISSVNDSYNLATVLKQSGLPADFDPSAPAQ